MDRKRLKRIYQGIKQRCCNNNCNRYMYYGAKGIKVCDEWKSDFQSFYKWAISNGYRGNLTIDRIDVNGNYEPSNCRWISMSEQQRNKSRKSNTGVLGVYYNKTRKWYEANIRVGGVRHYLGIRATLEEAAALRKQAEIEFFKEDRV